MLESIIYMTYTIFIHFTQHFGSENHIAWAEICEFHLLIQSDFNEMIFCKAGAHMNPNGQCTNRWQIIGKLPRS